MGGIEEKKESKKKKKCGFKGLVSCTGAHRCKSENFTTWVISKE